MSFYEINNKYNIFVFLKTMRGSDAKEYANYHEDDQ